MDIKVREQRIRTNRYIINNNNKYYIEVDNNNGSDDNGNNNNSDNIDNITSISTTMITVMITIPLLSITHNPLSRFPILSSFLSPFILFFYFS
jgi:hypothetical protein